MSREDLRRFTEELRANAELSEEFEALGEDPKAWRKRAAAEGYDLTPEEAGGLTSSYRELSDDELEDVAGGWPDGTTTDGTTSGSGGG